MKRYNKHNAKKKVGINNALVILMLFLVGSAGAAVFNESKSSVSYERPNSQIQSAPSVITENIKEPLPKLVTDKRFSLEVGKPIMRKVSGINFIIRLESVGGNPPMCNIYVDSENGWIAKMSEGTIKNVGIFVVDIIQAHSEPPKFYCEIMVAPTLSNKAQAVTIKAPATTPTKQQVISSTIQPSVSTNRADQATNIDYTTRVGNIIKNSGKANIFPSGTRILLTFSGSNNKLLIYDQGNVKDYDNMGYDIHLTIGDNYLTEFENKPFCTVVNHIRNIEDYSYILDGSKVSLGLKYRKLLFEC